MVSRWWDEFSMRPMGVVVLWLGSHCMVLLCPLRSILSMVLFQDHPGWSPLAHYTPCESMSSVVRSCFMFVCVNCVAVVIFVVVVVLVCRNAASFCFVGVDVHLVPTVNPIVA